MNKDFNNNRQNFDDNYNNNNHNQNYNNFNNNSINHFSSEDKLYDNQGNSLNLIEHIKMNKNLTNDKLRNNMKDHFEIIKNSFEEIYCNRIMINKEEYKVIKEHDIVIIL